MWTTTGRGSAPFPCSPRWWAGPGGGQQGRAVIQTFTLRMTCRAARQDYDSFYEQEIELRRMRLCPPFRELFVLTAWGRWRARCCAPVQLAAPPEAAGPAAVSGLGSDRPGPAPGQRGQDQRPLPLPPDSGGTKYKGNCAIWWLHLVRCAQTDKEWRVSVSADVNPLHWTRRKHHGPARFGRMRPACTRCAARSPALTPPARTRCWTI